jgi:rSAM/selenodomain-associated transferase 1
MTGNPSKHLIVYAKRPLPGYAKTRLGSGIGAENAAGLYARLLYGYLIDLVRAGLEDTALELSVASPDDVAFFFSAFPELRVHPQIDGDLGQRMATSFARAFDRGAASVVLTGSDIPGLDSTLVRTAFQKLQAADVVLGPAADGGYYLIGMRTPCVFLFEKVEWSTDRVLAQTEALARAQGLEIATLSQLYDIDTRTEYERWRIARASIEGDQS